MAPHQTRQGLPSSPPISQLTSGAMALASAAATTAAASASQSRIPTSRGLWGKLSGAPVRHPGWTVAAAPAGPQHQLHHGDCPPSPSPVPALSIVSRGWWSPRHIRRDGLKSPPAANWYRTGHAAPTTSSAGR
ncbi:translation initiation factor IF-2 [Triticum aestivum]|uniref:translation initiation factor IF-2 n=1 Tax=Triticum aestivum TaxID=4565 RepID=UPI001D028E5B|nr:translation initiation factor IF-2-like [Triticum aestivum]